MTEIIKKELERNIRVLKSSIDDIIPLSDTTEEIVKLNFEAIRVLLDYCEQLSLEGETVMERWLTSPRLAEFRESKLKREGGCCYG